MLSPRDVISSVRAYWSIHISSEFLTIDSGTHVPTDRVAAWFEIRVDSWSDPPRRLTGPDLLEVIVSVHCFARRRENRTEGQRLVATARDVLSGALIEIHSADIGPSALIGYLRVREHAVQDLTRNHAALGQEDLQHLLVTFQAQAQSLPTAAP